VDENTGKRSSKAYKIFDNVREKVEALFRESGIDFEGDFLEHMASVYELNQLKTGVGAGYQKQITTLEYHAKSVVDIFVSMIQTEAADRISISEGYEEKIVDIASEIRTQQDEIKRLNQALAGTSGIIAKQEEDISEARKLTVTLQKSAAKDEQLLAENKERIDRLSRMLSDTTERVTQAEALEQRFSELTWLTEDQAKKLEKANTDLKAVSAEYEATLTKLYERHAEDLKRATARAEIDKERAVLAARRELSDQAEKERKEHYAETKRLYSEVDKLRQQLAEAMQRNPKGRGR
jgi:chromosome segregation ATPase